MGVNRGFSGTCGTRGLNRLLKPLMNPRTSTRLSLARVTAPWIVALSAGVSMMRRPGVVTPREMQRFSNAL